MKKLLFLLIAATMFAASASAQTDPISLHRQQTSTDTIHTLETQHAAYATFVPRLADTEHVSARNYTFNGHYLGVLTVADSHDTIVLHHANYSAGQIMLFTSQDASTTDTVNFIPDAGSINGASVYHFTGTPYKSAAIFYDGANYFLLNKQ
jgi:hypothetical protein